MEIKNVVFKKFGYVYRVDFLNYDEILIISEKRKSEEELEKEIFQTMRELKIKTFFKEISVEENIYWSCEEDFLELIYFPFYFSDFLEVKNETKYSLKEIETIPGKLKEVREIKIKMPETKEYLIAALDETIKENVENLFLFDRNNVLISKGKLEELKQNIKEIEEKYSNFIKGI